MIKNNITASFAERLRSALINAGFHSQRSTSGVNILQFAQAIQHTPQICRKYLRGQTIPEPEKLKEIAQLLHVSPGWLLFGDSHGRQDHEKNKITISKNILHHLFSHISQLCSQNNSSEVLPNFWLELTEDLQAFDNNEETSKKMIDIALSSFKHLSQNQRDKTEKE